MKNVKSVIYTKDAPEPVGPYSQGTLFNGVLYLSGQLGMDAKTGQMVAGGVEAETEQILHNIKSVLHAGKSSLDNVIKATCFLADINDFPKFNAIYEKHFANCKMKPARSTFQVAALPKGARIEIEVIAVAEE